MLDPGTWMITVGQCEIDRQTYRKGPCGSVSKNDKNRHIYSLRLKGVLVKFEKYGTMSIFV